MRTGRSRRRIAIAAYSSIFLVLGLGLVLVLPAGDAIVAAPQVPAVGEVGGEGRACLGERLAFVQSGIFVAANSLASPSSIHDLGPELLSGQIDRTTGTVVLAGECAETSELGAVPAVFTGRVLDGVGLEGDLTVGSTTGAVSITAFDEEGNPDGGPANLRGGALLSRIFLAMAVVIVAARLVGAIFRRVGQPRVIGEITAGIFLGPSLLGLVFPEVTGFLFPASVTDVLRILAQFGLIFFMFLIGLELDRSQIRGSGHTAILISHYSIVIPLVLGMASALLVFPMVGSGNFTGFALFMGAAMAITAFPVLARILTDTGLHRTRIGALAITCAAVDDITAWCVLAVVVAMVKSTGPLEAVTTVSLALAFVLIMLFVVRPLAHRVMTTQKGHGPMNPTVLSFLIAGLFLAAWATEMIGIHAIFGAFMFGAVLPRERGIATGIIERLEDVTVLVLLPIFFAVVGLSTRIGLVTGRQLWLLTGLIILIAVVGKVGGSIVAGLAAGESLRTSTVIGVLMNARGITEIVILTIGMELGVISPALFTIMVLMALTTTLMTTPLLSRLYPRRMVERDIVAGEHSNPERSNYNRRRVMVGVTDPVTARPLVEVAGWIRGDDGEAGTVVLTSVVAPTGHEQIRAHIGDFAETNARAAVNLSTLSDGLHRQNINTEVITRIGIDRGEELRLICHQQDIDLLVVGSHEAYLRNRPLGGLVAELLNTAPCDVAVVINGEAALQPRLGPVGVWLSGDNTDFAALDLAFSLARGLESPVRAVAPTGVQPYKTVDEHLEIDPGAAIGTAVDAFEGTSALVIGSPTNDHPFAGEILEAARSLVAIPLIVLRTGLSRPLDRPHRRVRVPAESSSLDPRQQVPSVNT